MLRVPWRRWASLPSAGLPAWLGTLLRDVNGTLGDAKPYRFIGWPGTLKEDVKARLVKGAAGKPFRRVELGEGLLGGFRFQSPLDNPFAGCPEEPPAVWWDGEDAERVWVQLGPQFPPLFWIPIKGNRAALERLFEEYEHNDELFLERNIPEYEAYLARGAELLALGHGHAPPPLPAGGALAVGKGKLGVALPPPLHIQDASSPGLPIQHDGRNHEMHGSAADTANDADGVPAVAEGTPRDVVEAGAKGRTLKDLEALLGAYDTLYAPAAAEPPAPPAVAGAGGHLPQPSAGYVTQSLVPWAAQGETGDLYRRAAGSTEALRVAKEHSEQHWYFLGTTVSPEDVEAKMMANPFLFGRWPSAVVGGDQRRAATVGKDAAQVYCSVFRSVYSKSKITFTTREDEPFATVNVEGKKYKELAGLYCCVDHPSSLRMSGGRAVVEWYNREFGCDFPLTTPVDVVAALALFRPKAVTQVAAEYEVAGGRVMDNTKDVLRELARRQRASLTQAERDYLQNLDTLAAGTNEAVMDDASNPSILQLTQYIRRLALMKYPAFEEKCFKPFWHHDSKYVRVKVHEACVLAGREDLAQIMLARESDAWVVSQIGDVSGRSVADPPPPL